MFPAIKMGLLPVMSMWSILIYSNVMASCSDNQQEKCVEKYYRSTSFWFPTNELKKCNKKSYAHFSHICTVEDYLPNVDHCCCSVPRIPATNKNYKEGKDDNVVMCCRYHQDWDRFRCVLEKDVVDPDTFHDGSYASLFGTYPYNLFFYMLFVLLTIILIVIVIYLFRKFSRNKRRIYKQVVSNENRLISETNNVQSTSTNIINTTVSDLPPYTEKLDNANSRRRSDPHPSAPYDDLDDEVIGSVSNHNVRISMTNTTSQLDVPIHRETPPPPYELNLP